MSIKSSKKIIILCLSLFFIISIISIYGSSIYNTTSIINKQLLWYLIGFFIIILLKKINMEKIINYSNILYLIGNFILILLLLFGTEINGSKCWFVIPGLGSFQPSEFMKIIIILINSKILCEYYKKNKKTTLKSDLKIFCYCFFITLIPGILTFLQPDTGIVIIYFIITFIMLYVSGIKKSIFIVVIMTFLVSVSMFLYFYFYKTDNFINLFGTNFFYRIDRLLDWSNKSGMQLTNALAAIKSAGIFGFGIGKTPIYIPESHTDFIFSIYSNNTGFIGTLILLIIIIIFDLSLFNIAKKTNNKKYKYITLGFITMILYQQIQNISMNIGLLPITGITLPFISYGGSSLISYMLGIAIILNYNENKNLPSKKNYFSK